MSKSTVAQVHFQIADHCREISYLFKPGARITVIVRNPSNPTGEADMLVSDDDLDLVADALKRLTHKQKSKLSAEDLLREALGG